MRSILLVEPDVDVLGTLASRLRSRGLSVLIADSIDSALERSGALDPAAVLLSSQPGLARVGHPEAAKPERFRPRPGRAERAAAPLRKLIGPDFQPVG